MTKNTAAKGPQTDYRPKEAPGVSLMLTKLGKDILKAASNRTKKSKSDVVERLLREHGAELTAE